MKVTDVSSYSWKKKKLECCHRTKEVYLDPRRSRQSKVVGIMRVEIPGHFENTNQRHKIRFASLSNCYNVAGTKIHVSEYNIYNFYP
jgi:hypothetical protein